jgi:hypothetical protein
MIALGIFVEVKLRSRELFSRSGNFRGAPLLLAVFLDRTLNDGVAAAVHFPRHPEMSGPHILSRRYKGSLSSESACYVPLVLRQNSKRFVSKMNKCFI